MTEDMVRQMHDLTWANMTRIVPASEAREADYRKWRESFDRSEAAGTRHILHARAGSLRGYISYTPSATEIYWNEPQVHPDDQGRGIVLRSLLDAFAAVLMRETAPAVRTYANRRNGRSQALLLKLGFTSAGTTERGVRYTIARGELLRRLGRRIGR